MSRPDPKKNLTTLVEAFGKHAMLRELANLVLIMVSGRGSWRWGGSDNTLRAWSQHVCPPPPHGLQGNRDNIDSMASGSQKVLTQVLKLIDSHDLVSIGWRGSLRAGTGSCAGSRVVGRARARPTAWWLLLHPRGLQYGSVAYPKHHTQMDISDIYLFAFVSLAACPPPACRGTRSRLQQPSTLSLACCAPLAQATRGVFVNIALQEPFGLTVIEAAAHGVPTVATKNGGPVDIMATLHHGVVVDPTNPDAVAAALLRILTNPQTWDDMSGSGIRNIMVGQGGMLACEGRHRPVLLRATPPQCCCPPHPPAPAVRPSARRPTPGPPTARSTWRASRRRSAPSRARGCVGGAVVYVCGGVLLR